MRTWLEMTGSTNKSAFKPVKAESSIRGYLFSPEKKARKEQFRDMFPGRHMFGIVGKKNITFAKASKAYPISHEKKLMIERLVLDRVYLRNDLDPTRFLKYVRREFYHFSFYPKEVVDEIRQIIKDRKY